MSRSIKDALGAGVTVMSLAIWLEQAVLLTTFVVFARLLGTEVVGVAMMAIAIVLLGETLVRETFSDFLIQQTDLEDGHLNAVFYLLVAMALSIIALIWIFAPALASLYAVPAVTDLLRATSVTVLFVALAAVPVARLRRQMAFSGLAVRTILGPVVGGIAGLTAVFAGWGAWSLVVQRVVQGIVTDGFVWMMETWRPNRSVELRHFKEVWRYSSRMLGLRAVTMLALQTPSYVIGVMHGPAALALYTAAWRLVDALAFLLIAPVRFVAQPAFAALRRGEQAGAALLGDVSRAASLVTFASFAGVLAVASPLLTVLMGNEWAAAGPIMQVLSIVGLYFTIERIHEAYCLATGRAAAMLMFSVVELILGVILIVAVAPYGVVAIATAVTARYLLIWPFRVRYMTKLARTDSWRYAASLAAPAAAACIMCLTVIGARELFFAQLPDVFELASAIALGILVYCGLTVIFLRRRATEALELVTSRRRSSTSVAQDAIDAPEAGAGL